MTEGDFGYGLGLTRNVFGPPTKITDHPIIYYPYGPKRAEGDLISRQLRGLCRPMI